MQRKYPKTLEVMSFGSYFTHLGAFLGPRYLSAKQFWSELQSSLPGDTARTSRFSSHWEPLENISTKTIRLG